MIKLYKLSEIIGIIGGGTPKTTVQEYWNGNIPWLSVKDFNGDKKKVYQTEKHITLKGLKESSTKLLQKGDIIISARGTVGEVAILGNEMAFNQSCYGIRAKEGLAINDYIYYYLRNSIQKIKNNTHGSVFDTITRDTFDVLEISLPPLAEQKRIAEILSSLDDKIELNERMNKNLEEQAQALFKHWFVDFEFSDDEGKPYKSNGGDLVESELGLIPRGWRVGTLGEEFDITMGQSPKGESYNEIGDGMVFYQGRTDFKNRFPERRLFTNDPKRMAKKFDVLMSVRAPVGDVNVANEVCCIGRGLASISSEYQSYCLYKILSLKSSFDIFNGDGTVFGSITRSSFENIKIIVPKSEIILKFECNIKKIDKMIYNLSQEIQNLKSLRDTLLPRLMSGEV